MFREKISLCFFIVISIIAFSFIPATAFAQDNLFYISFKPGAFFPQDDIEEFDTGFSGELAFGRQFSQNFALEMDVGWINLEESRSFSLYGITYSGSVDIDMIPIVLSFKPMLPIGNWELYGVIGIGGYLLQVDGNVRSSVVSGEFKDNEMVFGFTPGLGIQYNINKKYFIGAEAKYLFTRDVSLFGIETNLNGIRVEGVFGIRF